MLFKFLPFSAKHIFSASLCSTRVEKEEQNVERYYKRELKICIGYFSLGTIPNSQVDILKYALQATFISFSDFTNVDQ